MLTHAVVLSALLSVSVSVATYLLTGDIGRVVQCVGLTWATISLACFRGQCMIADAHMRGRIARATYSPIPPTTHIIEHLPEITPVPPVPKPVERLRFIPMYSHQSQRMAKMASTTIVAPPRLEMRHGVDEADLRWFVSGLDSKGSHSRRRWEGKVAPSGRVVDAEYHALLVAPLVTCGAVTGRAERRAGSLVMEPGEILALLGFNPPAHT